MAVDNLVEGLAAAGVKPLRVGFAGSVQGKLQSYSLDAKRQGHPLYPTLDAIDKELEKLEKEIIELEKKFRKAIGELKVSTGKAQTDEKGKQAKRKRLHGNSAS